MSFCIHCVGFGVLMYIGRTIRRVKMAIGISLTAVLVAGLVFACEWLFGQYKIGVLVFVLLVAGYEIRRYGGVGRILAGIRAWIIAPARCRKCGCDRFKAMPHSDIVRLHRIAVSYRTAEATGLPSTITLPPPQICADCGEPKYF